MNTQEEIQKCDPDKHEFVTVRVIETARSTRTLEQCEICGTHRTDASRQIKITLPKNETTAEQKFLGAELGYLISQLDDSMTNYVISILNNLLTNFYAKGEMDTEQAKHELEGIEKISDTDGIQVINATSTAKVLVSSDTLTEDRIEEYKELGFDIVIHGISRIEDPKKFTEILLVLAENGVKEIKIPENKDAKTRLFRDFDFQALSNLMLLCTVIDVWVGEDRLKSEHQVLRYCMEASQHTTSARNNGFRKLTAEWMQELIDSENEKPKADRKSDAQMFGYFKGSLRELIKRAIRNEHNRTSVDVAQWFSERLPSPMLLVTADQLRPIIDSAINEAYDGMCAKMEGMTRDKIALFFDINTEELIEMFHKLSKGIEIIEKECVSTRWHAKLSKGDDCLDCDYVA